MNAADLETLRAFYVENRQPLYTYAVSVIGNREVAEDVIHAVFERMLRGRGLPFELRPYVFRSVRNAAFDALRRAKIRSDSIFESTEVVETADSGASSVSERNDFAPLLQQLSFDEREAIVLKIYGGFTFQQIAKVRQVPLPTVASWYRRGMERLKTMLNAEFR